MAKIPAAPLVFVKLVALVWWWILISFAKGACEHYIGADCSDGVRAHSRRRKEGNSFSHSLIFYFFLLFSFSIDDRQSFT